MKQATKIEMASNGSDARAGIQDFLLVMMPIMAFGIMFGAASSAKGYSIGLSLWSSASIFAGASQFVFLDVFRDGIPVWSVVLAVFAVNFRHILYSAAMGGKISHFKSWQKLAAFFLMTDLQFSVVEARYERLKNTPTGKAAISLSYYFSFGIACYVLWIGATLFGAVFGRLIENPASVGLDFILPIYFLSILMGFRKRSSFLPVVIASSVVGVLVQKTIGAPWHISLGALAGIAAGVIAAPSGNTKAEPSASLLMPKEPDAPDTVIEPNNDKRGDDRA